MIEVKNILDILRKHRFSLQNEKTLQAEIHQVLLKNVSDTLVKREHVLDAQNTIDFFIRSGIGIEVKIRGNKMEIYRQCVRYCQFPEIRSFILITNTSMGIPPVIVGTDCYVIKLGTAWL